MTAVYLLAVAAVIVAQLVFSPFYRNVVDVGDIWHVMNWFMAASIIITLVVRYHDKLQLDREDTGGGISRRYLETYAGFVVTVFLALWFFWNWGDEFITSSGAESDTNLSDLGLHKPSLRGCDGTNRLPVVGESLADNSFRRQPRP